MRHLFFLVFMSCSVEIAHAKTYVSTNENDPLLRAAKYDYLTQKPYQAAANIIEVLSRSALISGSNAATQELLTVLDELGIDGSGGNVQISQVKLGPGIRMDAKRSDADLDPEPEAFQLYNKAIAYLTQGRNSEGLELMKVIARTEYSLEEERLLRDKTNLALGFYFLDHYQFKTASVYFERVRRLSPYGKKALIGLGWSLLNPDDVDLEMAGAPDTGYLWFASGDDIAKARRKTPFRHSWSVVSGEKKKDLLRAMVPWMELINDDPLDPAVQEGMLTLPYAMVHLGDINKAVEYYHSANERLGKVIGYLDVAIASVQQGNLSAAIVEIDKQGQSGWDIWLCSLLDANKTEYLHLLIEDATFLRALREFRQLFAIRHSLHAHHQQVRNMPRSIHGAVELSSRIERFLPTIEKSVFEARDRLELAALNVLSKRRQDTERYLAESRLALARIHENPRKSLKRYIRGDWQ